MLTVTESAKKHLQELLEKSDAEDEAVVRFVLQAEGISMGIDQQRQDDQTFEQDGKVVLVMQNEVAQALDGKSLDVEQTETEPKLVLQ